MRNLIPLVLLLLPVLPASGQTESALDRVKQLGPLAMDEVLWLGRAVYSESDRASEQKLVAWVIRNRVETGYRGTSYREVVLEPLQFSAFNTPSERRDYILAFDQDDVVPSWMQALDIALEVYGARPTERPFDIDTRHFYSPVSMVGRSEPVWASAGIELSSLELGVDPNRFRFFRAIDQSADLAGMEIEDRTVAMDPSAAERIDQQQVDRQVRAAERSSTVRRSTRVRRFSGRITRPARPRTRGGGD